MTVYRRRQLLLRQEPGPNVLPGEHSGFGFLDICLLAPQALVRPLLLAVGKLSACPLRGGDICTGESSRLYES